jgi:TRAP-type C4-dicarboxylate transport system permease small subunit
MKRLIQAWLVMGKAVHTVAGSALLIMFLVTLAEVMRRTVWRPIPGAWEMISFLGGIVIGLSVPHTSQKNGHVAVDFAVVKMPQPVQNAVAFATRVLALAFFALIGWGLISMGIDYRAANEVSQSLKVPFYPVAIAMGVAFLIQAFQFLLDTLRICGGHNE